MHALNKIQVIYKQQFTKINNYRERVWPGLRGLA